MTIAMTIANPRTPPGLPVASARGDGAVATTMAIATLDHGETWARVGAAAGGVVSIAGNVLETAFGHAVHPGAVFGAFWWPVCLFLAIEVFAARLWGTGAWSWLLRAATSLPVAAVAATTSYHHLSKLLDMWGEDGFTVRFGPVAVDGLMLLCAGALYRARAVAHEPAHVKAAGGSGEHRAAGLGEPSVSPVCEPSREPASQAADEPASEPGELSAVGGRARRNTRRKAPTADLLECDCGLDYCPGRVPKSTRTRHRAKVSGGVE